MADQVFKVNAGFFDAINRDRLYSADEMNRPYKRVISNGVFATPAGTPSTDLQVSSAGNGMEIIVAAGEGLFGDKWLENPTQIIITVPNNTALVPRKDSVIVQMDKRTSGRAGNIIYRTGTPAESPEAPPINTVAHVAEYRLATITVAAGANSITGAMIEDRRGTDECPWVTSLIYQVDTSALFDQYHAAFDGYFEAETADYEEYKRQCQADWDAFISSLTADLSVNTNVVCLTSLYIASADVSEVAVGIASYDPLTDVLMIFRNGVQMMPGIHYTVNGAGTQVILKAPLPAGQNLSFVCFKSVVSGSIGSAVQAMENIDRKVSIFTADEGWIVLGMKNGAAAYDSSNVPAVRCIGDRVYVRGAIKGMTSTGTTICTIPAAYKPAADHWYTSAAVDSSGNLNDTVTVQISAATGEVKLYAKSGSLSGTDMISLATAFLANIGINIPSAFTYKGSVTAYSNLPASPMVGDVYTVNTADSDHGISAGDEVVWDGTEWAVYTSTVSDAEIDDIIDNLS